MSGLLSHHQHSWQSRQSEGFSMPREDGLRLSCDYSFEQPPSSLCKGIGLV
jgi:hypothetical protein